MIIRTILLCISKLGLNMRDDLCLEALPGIDRTPGMHQIIDEQDTPSLTPDDRKFLRDLRIAAD
jgi:hypothetical protein